MLASVFIDTLIIGGGAAGASLATLLARAGQTVAVLERSRYGAPRVGEMLRPEIKPLLIKLGVWERFLSDAHLPSPGILSAWSGELYENDFLFSPYGTGWHLDRRRFDETLALAAAEAGATVYRSTRALACRQLCGGRWQIEAIQNGKLIVFTADFLVEATGRASSLFPQPDNKRIYFDRLIALVKWLRLRTDASKLDHRLLVESCETGWWYSALLPGNEVVTVFLTDADLLPQGMRPLLQETFSIALSHAPHTRARLASGEQNTVIRTVCARSSRRQIVVRENWLALGDAATTFDPLSAQGVYKAIDQSFVAAKAISENPRNGGELLAAYRSEVEASFRQYLSQREVHYSRERRWAQSPFWRRRLTPALRP